MTTNAPFCPTCGNYFPEGTEFCQWCGGVLVGKFDNPVARGGLHAGSYGLGNRRAAGIMAGMGLIGGAVAEAIHQAARAGACPDAWLWLPIGLVGLILAYLGGYLLEWLLSAIRQTARMENDWLQRRKQSVAGGGGLADMADASPPSLWPGRNLLSTAGALAIACVYVVPLVTLPLLPLALLHLATGGLGKALNVTLSLRTAWRRSGDFILLWMVLFLWVAGLILALVLAAGAFVAMDRIPALVDSAVATSSTAAGAALWILLTACKFAIVAALACVFGLTIARCIGLFGRRSLPVG